VSHHLTVDDRCLIVDDLRCVFGGVQAVDGASFACREGQITGLIGPNGAGKSTVLNAIAGQVRAVGGSIRYRGADILGRPPHRIARLGISRTFQLANVFDRMTVLENLLLGARPGRSDSFLGALRGARAWSTWETEQVDKARELLSRCGLSQFEDHYAGLLSGGQKRLVEISRALMSGAEFVLLDEPMAGVNPSLAEQIGEYLMSLATGGLSMLMVEHEMSVVSDLCETVVVMAQGDVIMVGTMDEIRRDQGVVDAYLVG
jgi:ABC-type branched-subunit amino acid transport system ATPase component